MATPRVDSAASALTGVEWEPTLVPMTPLVAVFLLMVPQGKGEDHPRATSLDASQLAEVALDGPNWRPWEAQVARASPGRSKVPSATVEVVEYSSLERHQRLFEFMARSAPLLRSAYEVGYGFRTNVQMLGEFMAQDPSHPHPPSVPSVFYNNFKPPPENPALVEKMR